MEYLKIQNKGELDVRLISLMGGSTKQNNTVKIGKFGTGLKYSLSYLVRNNIDFKIFVGEKQIQIRTEKENISGTDFEIIYIDDYRSSITSSMGQDWEGWMICREIYCNALDEGLTFKGLCNEICGEEGKTTFYIQNTGQIKETVDKWDNYFITKEPIFENENFAIYNSSGKLCLYKQGVLIHKDKDFKSVFSYDLKNANINELREYKGYMNSDILNCLRNLDKKTAELFLCSLKENTYEWEMDYDWYSDFSGGWKEAIGQAKIIAKEDMQSFKERGIEIDEAAYIQLPKTLFSKLSSKFPGISGVRRADKVNSFHETIDKECEHKINKAISILEFCGYEINPELKWVTGVFGNPNVFARINIEEKLIMFSTELKRKNMFEVITCVVEENEHFLTGFEDCSRSFQQHFINLYTNHLLKTSKAVYEG